MNMSSFDLVRQPEEAFDAESEPMLERSPTTLSGSAAPGSTLSIVTWVAESDHGVSVWV